MRAASGCYRRRLLVRLAADSVDAGVEDDFHHFHVRIRHDGKTVTGITGDALRYPWVTCPGASDALNGIVGSALRIDSMRTTDAFDRFQQCTHQLELALLAIAAAARGTSRCYDVVVTDPDDAGRQLASLSVDGAVVDEWTLRAGTLLLPADLAGCQVRALRQWAETLDDDRYEQVAVLRRCLQVASGRLNKAVPEFASLVPGARNACYAFQDERSQLGRFISESVQDHSDRPQSLLANFS